MHIAQSLRKLNEAVVQFSEVCGPESGKVGVVLVDDNSEDATVEVARVAASQAPNLSIHILELPINVGQAKATLAGLMITSSNIVMVIDSDLGGQRHPDISFPGLVGVDTPVVIASLSEQGRPLWRKISGMLVASILRLLISCKLNRPERRHEYLQLFFCMQKSTMIREVLIPGEYDSYKSSYNPLSLLKVFWRGAKNLLYCRYGIGNDFGEFGKEMFALVEEAQKESFEID
jgi:glycosyltransferase involved in cell wall biosynthesis